MSDSALRELLYVGLLFGLFVFPRVLQRFGVPTAITALALGAAVGMGSGALHGDQVVGVLSTLGIVTLFLTAGLDVELRELRRAAGTLAAHLAVQALLLAGVAVAVARVSGWGWRSSALVALALLTPSTGFILDALRSLPLGDRERFWVRSKAIGAELAALAVLFVTVQSTSGARLALAGAALAVLVVVLPLVFRAFAVLVAPYAPRSELGFLVMVAAAAAMATLHLGVYYLVGAFVVGMAARRFEHELPALGSRQLLDSVEAVASLFVPFYFFHAGLGLRAEDLSPGALAAGLAAVAVVVPLRVASVAVQRRLTLRESWRDGLRVGVPLVPTLVFGLVVAQILRDGFGAPPWVFGGLVVYTVGNTLVPAVVFRRSGALEADAAPAMPAGRDAPGGSSTGT
jgi:Kef-type K+ transport system membrane component KefB